jgi:hypothetical protein
MKKQTRMSKRRPSNKTQKGGVFRYESLPQICGIGVHEEDCVPSTLHFLGILTYEAAVYLAQEKEHGITYSSIAAWFDETYPEKSAHVTPCIMDLRQVYLRTTRRGKNLYNTRLLNERNARTMDFLHYILPFNEMGVLASLSRYSDEDNQEEVGGHAFCIIKNEVGQIVLIDPQGESYVVINSVHDLLGYLERQGGYTMNVCIEQDELDGFTDPKSEVYGPNNYNVPNQNALNVERVMDLHNRENGYYENVREAAAYENSNEENMGQWGAYAGQGYRPRQGPRQYNPQMEQMNFDYPPGGRTNSNGVQHKAQFDRMAQRWSNSTGYYDRKGWYHYND